MKYFLYGACAAQSTNFLDDQPGRLYEGLTQRNT